MSFRFHEFLTRSVWWGLLSLPLGACTMGKDYTRPPVALDSGWQALRGPEAKPAEALTPEQLNKPWWEWFADPVLTGLVERALANNNDLKVAQARIAEARANERQTDSAFFPQIDATGNVRRGTIGGFGGDLLDTSKQGGLSGRMELDLFGSTRRRSEAAEAGTRAAEAAQRRVRLTLISEVARNYIRVRGLQQQLRITQKNLDLQNNTLTITQGQRDEMYVSQFDVLRARAQVDGTKSRVPQIRAELFAAMNRLAVLVADKPAAMSALLAKEAPLPSIPHHIIVNTPVSALENRPDVREAEERLAEATALRGAALADFFPKLTLEGFFGKSASNIYGDLSPWSASANALLPLLNFGRLQGGLDLANARQEQAFYSFQQSVLLAVEDTEVSFSNYLQERDRQETLARLAQEQTEAASIARERYISGIGQQLDLLDAERDALDVESQLISSQTLMAQNLVLLYSAMGDVPLAKRAPAKEVFGPPMPERFGPPLPPKPPTASTPCFKTKRRLNGC